MLGNATHTSPGTFAPEILSAARPATTAIANWTRPTTPMPATLPASNWWARTRASSTSTTAVVFSSTTPVSTALPRKLIDKNSSTAETVPTVRPTAVVGARVEHLTGERLGLQDPRRLLGTEAGGQRPLLRL